MMGELSKRPNIGNVVEEQLNQAGILTYEQLRNIGSRGAWLKLRETDPSVCLHCLYALEGAIQGIPKSQLPAEVKASLKEFFQGVQKK